MQIYISGPLQGSHDLAAARSFYDELGRIVSRAGHVAYIPHHNTDPLAARSLSSEDVFQRDIEALNESDAVIAHIGMPSTGVGAEIALAAASRRPILGIKRPHEPSSRFTEGLISGAGGAVFVFTTTIDLAPLVNAWLADANFARELPVPLALRSRFGHAVAV